MTLSVSTQLTLVGHALFAQRTRLDVVSANLANAETTRVAGRDGPYRRRDVILEARSTASTFNDVMANWGGDETTSVEVVDIVEDVQEPRLVYDPNHPDADSDGYVAFPNVNSMEEMVNMITAMRTYQANLSVVTSIQDMARRSLNIGRSV